MRTHLAGFCLALGIGLAAVCTAQGRQDFSGTWVLDRSISNDPGRLNFDTPQGNGRGQTQFGRRGITLGGRGGARKMDGLDASSTADERAKLAALVDQLKKGSATLVISHHDPNFVINDGRDQTQFLETDGSQGDVMLGGLAIASTARWSADQIVVDYALSSRRTLVYTYTLLPKTSQMVLRVRLEVTDGPRGNGTELKLVYVSTPAAK